MTFARGKGRILGMRIRKVMALMMSLVIAFPVCSCAFIDRAVKAYEDDPKRDEREYAEQVFEYVKNEDIDSLCELFAPEVSVDHSVRSEWKYFFDHMDGNAVSYKSLSYPDEGIGKDKDGEVYESHISVNYKGVKTGNGTEYKQFGYYRVQVNSNDPDSVGMHVFTMQDPETGKWYTVGGE